MQAHRFERPWGQMQLWSSSPERAVASSNQGPSGARLTVLAIHGLGGSGRYWDGLDVALAARANLGHVTVVAPDLAGFGGSAITPAIDLTRAHHLDDLDAVLSLLAPEGPMVVIGHSMGGVLAGLLAVRHPERVAGIAIVAAPEPGGDDLDFRAALDDGERSLRKAAIPALVAAWPILAPPIALLRDLPLPVVRDFANQSFRGRVWTLWSVVSEPAVREELAPLKVLAARTPALLLYAGEDSAIHEDAQLRWSQRMPTAEYRRIAGTGHQLLIQTRFAPLLTWLEAVAMK